MISFFISFFIFFGNPTKGFKEAANKNYPAAIEIFKSSLDDNYNRTLSYFGLATIYSTPTYIGMNYDTAYYYLILSEKNYKLLTNDEKVKANKLSISSENFKTLRSSIAFDALSNIDKRDIKRLEEFVNVYREERISQKVQTMLDERKFFTGKIKDTTDLGFYLNIIKRYPSNNRINEVWLKYYNLYTYDGKMSSFMSFHNSHPQFPYDTLLKKDWSVAASCDKAKLLEGVTPANKELYDDYINKAAPRIQAFEALQVYLMEYINAKNWTKALEISLRYTLKFAGNSMYTNFIDVLKKDDKIVLPKILPETVNSPQGHEYSPVISATGNKLFFAGMSRPDNVGGEDIFVSELINGKWQQSKPFPYINTKNGNEAPEAISVDETVMILYFNGDIFWAQQTPTGWSDAMPVKGINTEKWEGDAVLSSDGNSIIFSSGGWEKKGLQFEKRFMKDEFDLFVSTKNANGTWGKPVNLGTTINTPYCDRYPYLHPDMKTLYFSSQGHGSLGNSDVYRSVRLSDTSWTLWSKPENLGKYINTSGDDNGYKITTDGSMAYFSTRDGDIDIYSIDLPSEMKPEFVAIIKGKITDDNGKVLEAKIQVENLESGKNLGTYYSSPTTGNYVMVLPLGKNYGYYVTKDGYFPSSDNLDLRSIKTQVEKQKDFVLHSLKDLIEKKEFITIKNVFFEVDKDILQPSSFSELNRLTDILKDNIQTRISIAGHTDNTGSDSHNMDLSARRAQAVKNYLVKNGISETRMTTEGLGTSKPVSDNNTEEGKALNRRVEVLFVQ